MPIIIYITAQFPKQSETFVYREVLALRKLGVTVHAAGVRPSRDTMGNEALEALKADTIPIYGTGAARVIRDSLAEFFHHPARSSLTLGRAIADAVFQKDAGGPSARIKIPVQAFASLALAHRLRALSPSLLHAHMAHVPTTFAMYTARQLHIPFSFTGHAADIFRDRSLLTAKLKRAAFVNCISLWHREFYQSLCARPEKDYPVVRCGVDADEFEPHSPRGADLTILAVGRFVAKKGFDLLLEALADPELKDLSWKLTLVGDGPESARLHQKATNHPAAEKIELTGARSNDEVRAMMSRADLFVLPCRIDPQGDRDGIPVVLMEAMMAGAAVISGDIPSIRELIHSGENGLLVPPGDLKKLTGALIQLCTSSSMRDTFIEEGRKTVEHEFSQRVNAGRILDNLTERKLIEL
jgi:colanic acid/amylovoran biosynthesis glycosyltransferase